MPSSDTRYAVRGRFIRQGQPIAGAEIRLIEHDRGRKPTQMDQGRTGEDGSFEFAFTQAQADGSREGLSEQRDPARRGLDASAARIICMRAANRRRRSGLRSAALAL